MIRDEPPETVAHMKTLHRLWQFEKRDAAHLRAALREIGLADLADAALLRSRARRELILSKKRRARFLAAEARARPKAKRAKKLKERPIPLGGPMVRKPKQLRPAKCPRCGRRFTTRIGLGLHFAWKRRGKDCASREVKP